MIIWTPSSDSSRRSATVSTGSPPRSAMLSPSTTIRSGPSVPSRFSQPGQAVLDVVRDPRERVRVAQALERRRRAALLRPRGQQAREQGAAGAVGVLVEGHAVRGLELLQQRLDQRLVGHRLQVRDVEGRARAAGDVEHLVDRLEHAGALVADVRNERRAELGRHLRDRDELVGVGVRAREVDEAEGEVVRAGLEAGAHLPAHRVRARRGRRPPLAADHRVAGRAVRRSRGRARSRAGSRRARRGTRRTSARATSRGPPPRARFRYSRRSRPAPAATGAGASPSGLITCVVIPCASTSVSNGSSNERSAECACTSMKPGQSQRPSPSTTSSPFSSPPTAAIRPSAIPTSHLPRRRVAGVDGRAADDEHQTTAESPPSTTSSWPLTKSDAGEARKTTAPPSSAGSPQRPAGTRARSQASNSGVRLQRLVQLGAEVPGRESVRLDPVPRPLGAHRARQHLQRALRRRVGADRRARELAHHRADVDDLAAAALDHPGRDRARDEEGARQVDVEHVPPLVGLELDERPPERHAGVVDEHVDRPERRRPPSPPPPRR